MSNLAPRTRLLVLLAGLTLVALATLWLVDARVGRLWLNTAWLVGGAWLVALPLGTLAAVAIFKTDVPGRWFAAVLLTAMLFIPLFLVTGAWDAGFGIQGWHTLANNPHLAHKPWLAGWRAAIWIHGLAAVPWVVLIVGAGLRGVEAELEEDAALCASPAQVVWHVTLPRSIAAITVAALWVAIVASAEISVTDFFQVRTFAEEVYTQSALGAFDGGTEQGAGSKEQQSPPALTARGLWLGLLLSTVLALIAVVAGWQLVTGFTEAPQRLPWVWRLGRLRWPAAAGLWSILLLVAGVPCGSFIYKAGVAVTITDTGRERHWSAAKAIERVVAAPGEFRGELETSTAIGTAAALAALIIGLPLAWSLRFARRTPWLRLAALSLCLTIPGPLLGIGLIHILNQPPDSLFAPLAYLYDSIFAPWLAQTLRALPLVTLILWAALDTVPQAMLDAAAIDGCGWWGRLTRIALPQRWPAVVAAWLVGLAIAVGELAATVLVMPPAKSTTISIRVFGLLHYGVDDRVAAICLVFII
ncbi:MAG: ABC transporter permease subunit, partial [Pirellulales bacterium]